MIQRSSSDHEGPGMMSPDLLQYDGQWVALQGERLIAVAPSCEQVVDEARRKGVASPLVFRVVRIPKDVIQI